MAKILIVDDEKMICEEFRDILEDEGHEADVAYTGRQALDAITENDYAIVFLDVLMPRMEGSEVLEGMRRIKPSLPIVIMSGYLPQKKKEDILTMGAMACLKKPLNLDQVRSLIRTACRS